MIPTTKIDKYKGCAACPSRKFHLAQVRVANITQGMYLIQQGPDFEQVIAASAEFFDKYILAVTFANTHYYSFHSKNIYTACYIKNCSVSKRFHMLLRIKEKQYVYATFFNYASVPFLRYCRHPLGTVDTP